MSVGIDKELVTPLVHLHRGELGRMTAYRQRLDTTMHLAVVTAGALITFVLGRSQTSPHVLGLGLLLQAGFVILEATRYRRFTIFRTRVWLLERGFYGGLLGPGAAEDWKADLRASLDDPQPQIGLLAAIGVRLRVAHLFVIYAYVATWAFALTRGPGTWREQAAAGPVDGVAVAAGVAVLTALVTVWGGLRGPDLES